MIRLDVQNVMELWLKMCVLGAVGLRREKMFKCIVCKHYILSECNCNRDEFPECQCLVKLEIRERLKEINI